MQQIRNLEKQWRDSARVRGVHASMSLAKDGIVLGAGTVLAKRGGDGVPALEGEDAKVLTLLSVAYGCPVDAAMMTRLRRVSQHLRAGDECRAEMEVALALPVLADPRDAARRLFIADGLLAAGVAPRDIWTALEFDPAPLDELEKFNSEQPRVPAGSGRPSGRWTSGGATVAAGAATAIARGADWDSGEIAAEMRALLARLAARFPSAFGVALDVASRVAPPLAFASALLESSGTGGALKQGNVRGFPDLTYSHHQDETALNIVSNTTGHTVLTLYPTKNGQFIDSATGVIAHLDDDELVIGPPAGAIPQSRAEESSEDPHLCPQETADWDGRVGPIGKKDKDYEDHIKRLINPDNPTPRGMGYELPNPLRPLYPVIYDDCQHATGNVVDAKGTGYAAMLADPDGFMKGILTRKWQWQALNQVVASEGRQVEWYFAEKEAADYARELFARTPGLEGIRVYYSYWREGMP